MSLDPVEAAGVVVGAMALVGGGVRWMWVRHLGAVAEARAETMARAQLEAADREAQSAGVSTSQQLQVLAADVRAIRDSQAAQGVALAELRGEHRESVADLRGDVRGLRAAVEGHEERRRRTSERVSKLEERHEAGSRALWDEISQLRRGIGG